MVWLQYFQSLSRIFFKFIYFAPFFLLVPPQIIPFDFGDEPIDAGDLTTINCAISKGDFPVSIVWSLNGQKISQGNGIQIVKNNKKISALSIESVEAIHAGEYTCTATNLAGSVNHSAVLSINGSFT